MEHARIPEMSSAQDADGCLYPSNGHVEMTDINDSQEWSTRSVSDESRTGRPSNEKLLVSRLLCVHRLLRTHKSYYSFSHLFIFFSRLHLFRS